MLKTPQISDQSFQLSLNLDSFYLPFPFSLALNFKHCFYLQRTSLLAVFRQFLDYHLAFRMLRMPFLQIPLL